MGKHDELSDTHSEVAESAPNPGVGVSRAPDGSRMRSPESMNTTKDSENTEADKTQDKK
jgi:hypothetical protein